MLIYDKENKQMQFDPIGISAIPTAPSLIKLGYHCFTKADRILIHDITYILANGYKDVNPRPKYEDGTPAHTISVNHRVRSYDLSNGEFPICTLRPVAWKSGIREIFTIYQKPTNVISEMEELGVRWWNPWDIGDGTIGHRYGFTVKSYDLINKLIEDIKKDPYGRRHIVDLWQEQNLRETSGLAPCAFLTIWNVRNEHDGCSRHEYLDMTLIQRSGDMLTASGAGQVNEVQYAALLMMIARHTGYEPGVFTHFVANEQIYDRHIEAAKELIDRYNIAFGLNDIIIQKVYGDSASYPDLAWQPLDMKLNDGKIDFYDFNINDFTLSDYYDPITPNIKLPLGI